MPKVHFFKLAQELGEHPAKLQKKLAERGIAVQSFSTMVDEELTERIRRFLQQEAASTPAAGVPEPPEAPTPEPVITTAAAPSIPSSDTVPAPAVEAKPAPAEEAKLAAVEEAKPAPTPRIIKLPQQGRDGHPVAQRAEGQGKPKPADHQQPKVKKVRNPLLLDSTLSPDAEFGIVKAAGVIPLPQARPEQRPPQREGQGQQGPRPPYTPQQREGQPMRPAGPPRTDDGRPPRSGAPVMPTGGVEVPAEKGKGAPRGPATPAGKKKPQKRTVFTEREKTAFQAKRNAGATSGKMRSRRKQRGEGGREAEFVLEEPVIITGAITVGELAERAHVTPAQIISQLITMGILATVNQQIEPEPAVEVLTKLEIEALYEREMVEQASWRLTATSSGEAATTGEIRPPVVTILGHVDHGKTTLLDSIRKTHVTAQEFGGITQHIGAYQVTVNERKITFLDTPGHAAFTAMRARGANLTDIAVLVVAADDGIQPQTIEAIDHAKAAKVPIIVAINKIDLPDAQPEVVKQTLTGHGLVAEEWGGDTIMVPLSAKKGLNIENLLEMILLVADVQELRADATKMATGAVVESKLDKQRGPVATVLVQDGTLHVGDALILGMVSGKVRAMSDDKGNALKEAGPSTPVEITGLSEVPVAGDLFTVVSDEKRAREIAIERQEKARAERLQTSVSLQNLSSLVASGQVKDLNLIVKADVAGSIEAISQLLGQIEQGEIRVNIIHAGVGDVTESDVLLASASQAIIVGFHVRIETQARMMAEETGIDVRLYQVIYDMADDIEKAMIGMLTPVFEEATLGHAEVRAVFKVTRVGVIAGCYVKDGLMRRGAKVHVLRDGATIYNGSLDSLKHLKDDVREMAQGFECGIGIDNFSDWHEGDIIECYVIKELRRETL